MLLLVLWVLGACMIGMAALVWLPTPVAGGAERSPTIVLHNVLDGVSATAIRRAAWRLERAASGGRVPDGGSRVIVGYPLVPWIAIMALGFCFGPVFLMDRRRDGAIC